MGNGNFTPANYDETQMHEDFYTQSYTGHGSDRVPIGDGWMSIGAKIVQDPSTSELYVTAADGKRWFLTKGGKPLPNMADRVKLAANYRAGPALMITGPPSAPKYTMFSANDESTGSNWKPISINSYQDLYHAMKENRTNFDSRHAGSLGFAAVNPFLDRPRDVWSAVADENRAIAVAGAELVVPVAEAVLDDFVPFSSSVLNATGITDMLETGLSKALAWGYLRDTTWKSSVPFFAPMSNVLTDPRVDARLAAVKTDAQQWVNNISDPTLSGILREPTNTPQEKVAALQKIQERTKQLYATTVRQKLEHNLSELQRVGALASASDKADVGFDISTLQGGLEQAQTADEILHVAKFVNDKVLDHVVNHLTDQQKQALQVHPSTGSSSRWNQSVAAPQVSHVRHQEDESYAPAAAPVSGEVPAINGDGAHPATQHGDIHG